MYKHIVSCLAFIAVAGPLSLPAQQESKATEPPPHYYRLSYSIQEVSEEGKVTNSRVYTTAVESGKGGPFAQIRTGDKVPLRTDDKGNLNYMDVGVNIDTSRAQEIDGRLAFQINTEISSTVKGTGTPVLPPIIRQNKWAATVLVPIAKPTVIFSSDDLTSKGKLQVELTATRID